MFVADLLIEFAPECPVTSPVLGLRLPAGVVVGALPVSPVGAALSGARLDAGGPGSGRLWLAEDRRASARLPLEAFMRASHAGQPP
ncbi:hypothetical protein Aca07nite_26980 [Actinoplanes capillaceus]|uniref:Uncharacterized protein n=1 Tax=Actinoplanes campanulatus TaxID=113559 RepID=A0ABQ3WGQ5_9ACTN|nr:hypothetical protein Aca07nite_26980 [Actinoplanes capillaceus]